jgi:hypothetical protein
LTVDHQGHELRLDREAHFATELLPPGNYTVSLESSNTALGWARVNLELTAGQDRNLGDLVLPDTASIAVHLQAADGSRATGAILRIDAAEWQSSENLQPDEVDGIYRKVGIDAGKHVVRCFAPDAVPQSVPIELIGGQQRELEITVRRGVPVVIELRCGPEPRPSGILNGTLTVTDATGAQLVVHSLWGYYDDFWQKIKRVRCGLLPGTYHVDVKTWKTGALDITVPESGTPAPFVIDLR